MRHLRERRKMEKKREEEAPGFNIPRLPSYACPQAIKPKDLHSQPLNESVQLSSDSTSNSCINEPNCVHNTAKLVLPKTQRKTHRKTSMEEEKKKNKTQRKTSMGSKEANEIKLSLKLLIDRKCQKVLFAEAQKDFVDFLLSLLTLPVGSVIRLLKNHSMVGCIGNLYETIENLSNTYIQPGLDKNMLLNPKSPSLLYGQDSPLLLQNDATPNSRKFYLCCNCQVYVTDVRGVACPSCKHVMTTEKTFVANNAVSSSSVGGGGFVKGVITYTVMDDLVVMPMSTISSITLLNKFSVKDVGDLEESVVQVGMVEGLAILKASLHSKTVLTDIFLGSGMKKA